MISKSINLILRILSINKIIFESEVYMVVVSVYDGEIGIMSLHENFITKLNKNSITKIYDINNHHSVSKFFISDGYLHLLNNICTLCVDCANIIE